MAKRKKSAEDQVNENINESDDNFGLPEIEYEPINREKSAPQKEKIVEEVREEPPTVSEEIIVESTPQIEMEEPTRQEEHFYNADDEETSSAAPKVIGIIVVILLAAGAAWYFLKYRPVKLAEEKARQEEAARLANAEKLKNEQRLADLKRAEDEKRRADSLANATPAEGTIETLTERTRRYYIVVASAIDDDLIMDYAKNLSKKGVSSKIIPPFGKVKFFRIAVAEGETYADAQATADGLKAQYGDGAWVVKY